MCWRFRGDRGERCEGVCVVCKSAVIKKDNGVQFMEGRKQRQEVAAGWWTVVESVELVVRIRDKKCGSGEVSWKPGKWRTKSRISK